MARIKVRTKRKGGAPSVDAADHPWKKWWDHQRRAAGRDEIAPKFLVPGLGPQQYFVPLPEQGVTNAKGKPIFRIVDNRYTTEVIPGFPAALNRPCATMDEVDKRRLERRDWMAENCVKLASKRTGTDRVKLVAREKTMESAYGLTGLDVTLALRFGAEAGLEPKPLIEASTLKGAQLLWDEFGAQAYGAFYHPGNPFKRDGELGFGGHWQYDTVRALEGAYLSPRYDFASVGPATCSELQLARIGVDLHAYSRTERELRFRFYYERSSLKDWAQRKLEDDTITRIKSVQAAVAAGTTTVAAEVAKDLAAWDASFGQKKKAKDGTEYVGARNKLEVAKRNLASRSKAQKPVDRFLSEELTNFCIERMQKDPVWAPHFERAQRCAKEIETQRYEGGFKKTLTELLFEWEADDAAEQQRKRDVERDAEKGELQLRLENAAAEKAERALWDDAFNAGAEILEWSQSTAKAEADGEMAEFDEARDRERRELEARLETERQEKLDERKARAVAERSTAIMANRNIRAWLDDARGVMRGEQPRDRVMYRRHTSGRWQLIGGITSAGLVVKHALTANSAAAEFVDLAAQQNAALNRYDELVTAEGRDVAEKYLMGKEAKWLASLKAPATVAPDVLTRMKALETANAKLAKQNHDLTQELLEYKPPYVELSCPQLCEAVDRVLHGNGTDKLLDQHGRFASLVRHRLEQFEKRNDKHSADARDLLVQIKLHDDKILARDLNARRPAQDAEEDEGLKQK